MPETSPDSVDWRKGVNIRMRMTVKIMVSNSSGRGFLNVINSTAPRTPPAITPKMMDRRVALVSKIILYP